VDPLGLSEKIAAISDYTASNPRLTALTTNFAGYDTVSGVTDVQDMVNKIHHTFLYKLTSDKYDELMVRGHGEKGGAGIDTKASYSDEKKGIVGDDSKSLNIKNFTKQQVETLKETLKDDAIITIHGCGAGQNETELQEWANVFGMTVKAYTGTTKSPAVGGSGDGKWIEKEPEADFDKEAWWKMTPRERGRARRDKLAKDTARKRQAEQAKRAKEKASTEKKVQEALRKREEQKKEENNNE